MSTSSSSFNRLNTRSLIISLSDHADISPLHRLSRLEPIVKLNESVLLALTHAVAELLDKNGKVELLEKVIQANEEAQREPRKIAKEAGRKEEQALREMRKLENQLKAFDSKKQ